MRKIPADQWAGIAMFAVVLGAAVPILFGLVPLKIPYLAWLGLFIVMFVSAVPGFISSTRTIWTQLSFGLGVATSWVLLLSAHGAAGFFPIIVVAFAATSPFVVARPVTVVLVIANTAAIWLATWLNGSDWIELMLVAGLYLFLQIATVLSSIASIREEELRKQLSEANVELQATSVLLEETTRSAERLRISRDLHDALGHKLTVLSLELEAARHSEDATAREHVQRASDVAREVLGDLRRTVGEMRDEPGDLVGALRGVVDGIPRLEISVSVDDDVRVDARTQEVLVRAVQEIATNTLRHAEARKLSIRVTRDEEGMVRLSARDDGWGSASLRPGNGLRGMIERFDALGGEVVLDGSDGFSVDAKVPAA